jgi:hypothetical protein
MSFEMFLQNKLFKVSVLQICLGKEICLLHHPRPIILIMHIKAYNIYF